MEKNEKNPIEIMKQNPTFAPLAKLVEINAAVKAAAAEASLTASELRLMESNKDDENLPAIEPLFDLYSFYAEKATELSHALLDALEVSGVDELPERMAQFNRNMIQNLAELYATDDDFKAALDEAVEARKDCAD